jgi:acyl carrier protein
VLRHNASVTESDLKVFLADRLAQFKIPQRIVFIASIPRGATLKVQRIGLAEKLRDKLKQDFIAPTVALENLLASIYAEVLNTDEVGRHDNFFALGGDSLRATQVISRLRSLLHVNLPIATVFRKASVVELAQEINASFGPIDRALIDQIVETRTNTDC